MTEQCTPSVELLREAEGMLRHYGYGHLADAVEIMREDTDLVIKAVRVEEQDADLYSD